MTQQASASDIKNLSDHIEANKASVPAATAVSFCGAWPAAKAGLQLLQSVLQSIPGISMFAGWAVAVVIAAGDAASNALCGGSKP